jgi:hypothetical protein
MKNVETANRREVRPSLREDDSRTLAAQRAAEIRGNSSPFDDGVDEFATPPAPDGWSYEWKRKSSMNMEDLSHMNHVRRMGWTPVPVERHPDMMHVGAEGSIERKGMLLMERPEEITLDARAKDLLMARRQVKIKEGQLTSSDGLLGREDSKLAPKLKKSYEPMPIPND